MVELLGQRVRALLKSELKIKPCTRIESKWKENRKKFLKYLIEILKEM